MSSPYEEPHGWMVGQQFRLKADTTNPHSPKLKAGTVVKVVMVSRFGDCGITTNLGAVNGYSNRVMPFDLECLPNVGYTMRVDDPPDFMKQLGRTSATQLSIEQIAEMAAKGQW